MNLYTFLERNAFFIVVALGILIGPLGFAIEAFSKQYPSDYPNCKPMKMVVEESSHNVLVCWNGKELLK